MKRNIRVSKVSAKKIIINLSRVENVKIKFEIIRLKLLTVIERSI